MEDRLDAVCEARNPSIAVERSPQGAQGVVKGEFHSPY